MARWIVVWLASLGLALQPAKISQRRRAPILKVKTEEKVVNKRDSFEQDTVDGWEDEWDGLTASKQRGFDWEMEMLRRRAEDLPSVVLGPKFWRRMLMEQPESMYRSYAGSTYPGSKPGGIDSFRILFNNLLQFLGNDSEDGALVAAWDWQAALKEHGVPKLLYSVMSGDLQTLVGGPLFLLLTKYHEDLGPVYKLAFGPRSFIVAADPSIARHILKDAAGDFDKGILSEILEPIMGTGLIPAAPDVWKRRRRIISPAFHKGWLKKTLVLFDDCADDLINDLKKLEGGSDKFPLSVDHWAEWKKSPAGPRSELGVVDMEERLCSVSLDIIGRAVFDYDFKSISEEESPLVRAVYRCLQEAERRANAIVPFWLLPGSRFIPSQAKFISDLKLLNAKLDELILVALKEEEAEDELLPVTDELLPIATEEVSAKALNSSSLLRFLVNMRGEDVSTTQLRDDLMTMLVAGHETTAALLTWVLYELFHPSGRSQDVLDRLRAELDDVFGDSDRPATYEDVENMPFTRLCLAEGLRLYPQPPLLIRRALDDVELPRPTPESPQVTISRGSDVFISTWALHKSPALWENPEKFDPSRWERPILATQETPTAWKGYTPGFQAGLYPSEQSADYAYLPFGGGGRRCLGDQFALLESTVLLAKMIRNFDFEFALDPSVELKPKLGLGGIPVSDVGMRTGATIHTEHGLWMRPRLRKRAEETPAPQETTTTAAV